MIMLLGCGKVGNVRPPNVSLSFLDLSKNPSPHNDGRTISQNSIPNGRMNGEHLEGNLATSNGYASTETPYHTSGLPYSLDDSGWGWGYTTYR